METKQLLIFLTQKSTKILAIAFLLLFSFVSVHPLFAQSDTIIVLPSNVDSAFIYESNLIFKDNNFGGLLICKNLGNDSLRVSLTSKFGMNVFDFIFANNKVNTLYSVNPLDKKIIKNLLYKDFSLLYPFLFQARKQKINKNKIVLKKATKKHIYVTQNKKIVLIKKRSKLNSVILNYENQCLTDLVINHKLIGLKIIIKPLNSINE